MHSISTPVPANAVVAEDVDYGWLLPRTALVITNGGFGRVQQALAHRAAVIVAPGGEDKREVAARVGFFGVGVDMGERRPTPHQIRGAVDTECDSHAYEVEVQATAGVEFKDDLFTVNVAAPEGFDQAERRAIRRAVQRAAEWNAENAGANLPHRPESKSDYRVVSIGLAV
ncbi:glycosyltransferase [Rhodococcus sp. BH4]|uniref:glycosyltransferase n=1 Tax=Rhodococcus sp. BH4 TaxID=1807790 RepID=UPI0012EBA89D|nr:hypothetical protein [Rhodococcus sp. BH4]